MAEKELGTVETKAKSGKKEFVGIVKSDKMMKTIVVAIETLTLHPLYKKYVKRVKKVKAHETMRKSVTGFV